MKNLFITVLGVSLLSFFALAHGQEKREPEVKNPENSKNRKMKAQKHNWRFTAGLALNLGGNATSDIAFYDADNGDQLVSGEAEFDLDGTASLDFGARFMPKNSWGFMGGLTYDSERDVGGGEIRLGDEVSRVGEGGDTDIFQSTLVYGNAVYRWNQFFIPFGLNYGFATYEASGLDVDADGGIGAQFGAGYMVSENFSVEAYSRAVAFELFYRDEDSGIDVEFTNGFMTSVLIFGKYIF